MRTCRGLFAVRSITIPSLTTPAPDRLRTHFETTLAPRLAALEGARLAVRAALVRAVALVAPPLIVFIAGDMVATGLGLPEPIVGVAAFALILVAIAIAAMRYLVPAVAAKANYRARFKREIVSEIFKVVAPGAEYEPFESIAETVFDASGLFNARGSFWSDDRVRGRIGATPFEAAEVRRVYRTGTGQRAQTHTVFQGLFFHLDFNRTLKGTTIVQPIKAGGFQIGERDGLQQLATGHADFDRAFKVYGTDESESRSVLTTAMMDGVLALRQRADHPIFVAFKHNRAYLGVHYGRSLFEPGILSPTRVDALEQMAGQFALAEAVVRELDLNTRVWGKPADDSLLHTESAPKHPLNSPALTVGTLTEADVWKLAEAATGVSATDEDAALMARPETSRVEVLHDANGTTVAYGLPLSFFVLLVVSAAGAVIAMAALRAAGAAQFGFDRLEGWLATLPAVAPVDELVGRFPLPWMIGGAIVALYSTFAWTTRVRRVVVGHDAVRIYRGLRPMPRRYPRPLYGRIVQLERAVYVGKTGSSSLVNPSASPMLQSNDEARWVASEMRRAIRQSEEGQSLLRRDSPC